MSDAPSRVAVGLLGALGLALGALGGAWAGSLVSMPDPSIRDRFWRELSAGFAPACAPGDPVEGWAGQELRCLGVPTRPLSPGPIGAGDIVGLALPVEYVPEEGVDDPRGRVAVLPLYPGELVRVERLAP